jgi:hypothetical protein
MSAWLQIATKISEMIPNTVHFSQCKVLHSAEGALLLDPSAQYIFTTKQK